MLHACPSDGVSTNNAEFLKNSFNKKIFKYSKMESISQHHGIGSSIYSRTSSEMAIFHPSIWIMTLSLESQPLEGIIGEAPIVTNSIHLFILVEAKDRKSLTTIVMAFMVLMLKLAEPMNTISARIRLV